MASREPVRLISLLRSTFALVATAVVLAPVAGSAASLSQVRIGTHEDHTRVVLELDEATSYRLTPPTKGGSQRQIQIQLDAESAARHVASRSPLVEAVRVTPSARGATVFVDLSQTGVGISEMILADPPRIVLDLASTPTPVAARTDSAQSPVPSPAPERAPAPQPTPAPTEAATDAAAAPAVPAVPPEPAQPVPSLSDPVPSDVADAEAAALADPVGAESAASGEAEPVPYGGAYQDDVDARREAERNPRDDGAVSGSAPSGDTEIAAVEPEASPSQPPVEVVVRKPTAPEAASAAAGAASAQTTWVDQLLSPVGYAGIGIVLLLLVVLAVRRRRHDEDEDPLYSVMSAEDVGEDEDGAHTAGMAWNQRDDEAEPAGDASVAPAASFFDDEPVDRDGAQQLSLARSRGVEVGGAEDVAAESVNDADSLFREPGPATPLAVSDEAAPSFEPESGVVTHLAAELGERVQELERRLEQLTEARERLERQVAAQTEELRVQRAAIARTQRVVRSMTKGEDLATEPVPRAPWLTELRRRGAAEQESA